MRWAARWWAPDHVVPLITLKCRTASVTLFAAPAEADEPVPPPEPSRSATSSSDKTTIRNGAHLMRPRRAWSIAASPPSLLLWVFSCRRSGPALVSTTPTDSLRTTRVSFPVRSVGRTAHLTGRTLHGDPFAAFGDARRDTPGDQTVGERAGLMVVSMHTEHLPHAREPSQPGQQLIAVGMR